MTTIQELIDLLLSVEDKSQTAVIWLGDRYHEIGEVTSDGEGVYLAPEDN